MNWALLGAFAGSFLGLVGGIVGTYFAIKNAKGEKEKAFIVRSSLVFWTLIIIVAVAALLIPFPYKFIAFAPMWFLVPLFIYFFSKKLREIRQEEKSK